MNDFCIFCGTYLNENGDLICSICKNRIEGGNKNYDKSR